MRDMPSLIASSLASWNSLKNSAQSNGRFIDLDSSVQLTLPQRLDGDEIGWDVGVEEVDGNHEEDDDFQQTQGESQEDDDDEPMEEENFEDIQDDEDDIIEPGKNGNYLKILFSQNFN